MINGSCLQCGEPAFLMGTSIECSNNECKHFDHRLVIGLLEEPQFDLSKMKLGSKNKDWYWFRNADGPNLPSLNHDYRIGEPHGNDIYNKEELKKYGMVGLYAKKGSDVKKCDYVNSFGQSSRNQCPVIKKIRKIQKGKNS